MSTSTSGQPQQLHMLWPVGHRPDPTTLRPQQGYVLRLGNEADVSAFRALMAVVELGEWGDEKLAQTMASVLSEGWQVVVHEPDGALVATGMAQHNPIADLYPDGYEVGWIAAHPDHAGKGLGRIVTAAATTRLADEGVERIFLRSDDSRLPALKTYLGLGFVPHLYAPDMPQRWAAVCERLGWPYTPEDWPTTAGVAR